MKRIFFLAAALTALCGCTPDTTHAPVDPSLCDFSRGACNRGALSLDLSPTHAPSETPLTLALTLPDGAQVVSARIEGRDMFMGQYPVQFDGDGRAEVMYGSCASDYMVWRLWLTVAGEDGTSVSRYFDWRADAPN